MRRRCPVPAAYAPLFSAEPQRGPAAFVGGFPLRILERAGRSGLAGDVGSAVNDDSRPVWPRLGIGQGFAEPPPQEAVLTFSLRQVARRENCVSSWPW